MFRVLQGQVVLSRAPIISENECTPDFASHLFQGNQLAPGSDVESVVCGDSGVDALSAEVKG